MSAVRTPLHRRWGWHAAAAWRAGRNGVAVAAAGGLAVRLVLPVEDAWIAAAAGAACVALAALLLCLDRSALPPPASAGAALELLGTTGQWAQAFLRSGLVLAGFAAGLAAGALLGLDRA